MSAASATSKLSLDRLFMSRLSDTILNGLGSPENASNFPSDPVDFIRDVLGGDLWEKQVEVAAAVRDHRRVAVKSCHASGKSWLAARLVIWYLMTYPQSIVLTTAPTNNQVKNILWRNVNAAARGARRPLLGRALQTQYEIAPDWYGLGFKSDDTASDRFQGFHAAHAMVVIDEAAGVAEAVYDALDAVMTSEDARLLLIGNPTNPGGAFHAAFHADRAIYHTITIRADDTPNISAGETIRPYLITQTWIDDVLATHGADSPYVRSRVYAEFPEASDTTLIPLAWIEAADARRDDATGDPIEVGLDVARTGSDETAICVRCGSATLLEVAWNGLDTMETVGRVRSILVPYRDRLRALKIDVIGIGAGVVDRLREERYPVVPVNVGGKSSNAERFANLRHELWWDLRERFREGTVAGPINDVTMGQLSDIRYAYDSRHTAPIIESKDAMRKRGKRSPDRAEALLLAFTNPPRPRSTPGILVSGSVRGWQP